LAGNEYIYFRKNSDEASDQLVAWNAGNLWPYEPIVDYMTNCIVGAEYSTQRTISGIPAMVMASVKTIATNYAMFVNPFAMNAVKTAQMHSWWYEEITRINPAQRQSDDPRAYISLVNESSQKLFTSQTLKIRRL